MSDMTTYTREALRAAASRLTMLESARARRTTALFLADAIERDMAARKELGVEDQAQHLLGRMACASCRQLAEWEYLDREVHAAVSRITDHLFGDLAT